MFKTLKILWLEIGRIYHRHLVGYYDKKADRQRAKGYCSILYRSKAWGHLDKEHECIIKRYKLKDT